MRAPALECWLALVLGGCAPEPGALFTVVGSGAAGLGGEGVSARDAELYIPMDVVPGDGALFILDWNNNRVRRWDLGADSVSTVIGSGLSGDGPDGVAPTEANLNHCTDLTRAPDGRYLLADWHNHRLKWVTLDEDPRIEAAYGTGEPGFRGDGGPATEAQLRYPVTVRFDGLGRLLIADQGNNRVRRVEDGVISTIVGTGLGAEFDPVTGEGTRCVDANPQGVLDCFTGDGGPATEATLNNTLGQSGVPMGRLEVADDGDLYLADTKNHVIRRVRDGIIETVAGLGGQAGRSDGELGVGTLSSPHDLALAPDGSVYIADTDNDCVRVLRPDGALETAAGICGQSGYAGDGGPPDEALLNAPYGVAVDADGFVYVADSFNHVVRGFAP